MTAIQTQYLTSPAFVSLTVTFSKEKPEPVKAPEATAAPAGAAPAAKEAPSSKPAVKPTAEPKK
jgi:hypothetical protein